MQKSNKKETKKKKTEAGCQTSLFEISFLFLGKKGFEQQSTLQNLGHQNSPQTKGKSTGIPLSIFFIMLP